MTDDQTKSESKSKAAEKDESDATSIKSQSVVERDAKLLKSQPMKESGVKSVNGQHVEGNDAKSVKSQPVEGRCQFYLERKRRYCRSIPPTNDEYCVEHSHLLGNDTGRKRIKCPLDPKHTCYEDQLKNHLKKCNARESAQPVYYVRNINLGECDEKDKDINITVGSVSSEEIFKMVEKVHDIYRRYTPEIREEILLHDILKDEVNNPTLGDVTKKHLRQQASLVGHMDKLNLLRDKLCYIEFGAGKGGLSHWVQKAAHKSSQSKYLLVERGSVRYKVDSLHNKGENKGPNFERLRIDIQHLYLHKVKSLQDSSSLPLVGIGKHLCGGATDLMLRCLVQQTASVKNNTVDGIKIAPVEAMVLALCCHHRCDWQTYVGKQFFMDLGLTATDFHLMASMTSWATCATRTFLNKLAERDKEAENPDGEDNASTVESESKPESKRARLEHDYDQVEQTNEDYHHPKYGSFSPEQREVVGYQCKKLIDYGRLKYIETNNFKTELIKYTTSELSLENIALIATKK